jgi:TonB family protein
VRAACFANLAAATLACGGSAPPPDTRGPGAGPPPESEAPVALNPDVPIAYPPALFEDRIEGDVVLRLFVDTAGRLVPESTRVAESSDYPALDSAALAGSAKLRFAPAKRRGVPVATAFLQPVEFRYPGTSRTGAGASTPGAAVSPPSRRATIPAPQPPSLAPAPRVVAPPVRSDSARPRPDTTKPDTTRARRDTTRRDTTRVTRDTGAPPR